MFLTDKRYSFFTKYATLLLILFGVVYKPIEFAGGFGPVKLACMISAVLVLITKVPYFTKALFIGIIYVAWQFFVAFLHPLTFRASTIFFSVGLVFTYVCFYNLLYTKNIFTIEFFIRFCRKMMLAYFIVCVIQQFCIIIGKPIIPWLNLDIFLDRGIGCSSLAKEPSSFARTMLVFYYCYVKCCEYVRGEGPFEFKELFQGEYKWVTIRFLWMMCTMGSGTAFVCLIAFSLYFVRKNNWFYIIPSLLVIYFYVLPQFDAHQLNRATAAINATATLDQETVEEADGSAGSRISPAINSLNADLTDPDTWFGHGIDYVRNHNLVLKQTATLFDDYGLIFYIITLILDFNCAYRIRSLGALFMFMGIGGGAGTNIYYGWWLMMLMTCQRYFYENRFNLELEPSEEDDEENDEVDESVKNDVIAL